MWRKPTNDRDSKPVKNSVIAICSSSVFVSVFIEASKIILFNIFFKRLPKKFRNHSCMKGKY